MTACASERTGEAQQPIVNGTLDPADPAVVALVRAPALCGGSPQVVCSGTLISSRAVLTAAHCVEDQALVSLQVFFGSTVEGPGELVPIQRAWIHPAWDQLTHDIAVVALARSVAVAPVPLVSSPPGAGETVRVVGFGLDEFGSTGAKRQGDAMIFELRPTDFVTAPNPAATCQGDSGGPVIITGELVAGVTSHGASDCDALSVHARVDTELAFVQPVVAEIDALADAQERAAIDPAIDYCIKDCVVDSDCPASMACVSPGGAPRGCGFLGMVPGRFGEPCSGACAGNLCVDVGNECRCYVPCGRGSSGCQVGDKDLGLVFVMLVGGIVFRRGYRKGTQRGTGQPANAQERARDNAGQSRSNQRCGAGEG